MYRAGCIFVLGNTYTNTHIESKDYRYVCNKLVIYMYIIRQVNRYVFVCINM